jgi:hypothetical protein
MAKFEISHNTFNCAPCREIIKFYGVSAHQDKVRQSSHQPARQAA